MGRELRGSSEPPVGASVLCLCSNIIDVSAADSQGMEQHEYMDRARQYRWELCFSPGVPAVSSGRSQGFWPGGVTSVCSRAAAPQRAGCSLLREGPCR